MVLDTLLDSAAARLNDHAVSVVIGLAALALLAERVTRATVVAGHKRRPWSRVWTTNGALLGCALTTSWIMSPWLSPAFSNALSAQTGVLVWLNVAQLSYTTSILLGVLLLDFMIYSLHRLLHAVPLFWRLHQVHHSDADMNASTHFRQHPLQLVLAPLLQLPLLWLLGVSGVSWVLYAAISTAIQLWQHADLRPSPRLDRWLLPIFVTPTMHCVHHDHRRQFHDTNYGALFSFWDRLLGTYTATPPDIRLGLNRHDGHRATHHTSFVECLWMPFQSSPMPAAKAASHKFQMHFRGKK